MAADSVTLSEAAEFIGATPAAVRRLAAAPGPLSIFRDSETGEERITRGALRRYTGRRLEPHLSVNSAAELLDVSRSTINRLIRSGELRPRILAGRRRIPESELLALLTPAP